MVTDGDVTYEPKITPDSRSVIYRADQDVDEKFELYLTVEGIDTYLPMVLKGRSAVGLIRRGDR